MPTEAKLKPSRIEDPLRTKQWVLRIPPYLSKRGVRERLFFATKQEAEEEALKYREEKKDLTRSSKSLSLTDARYAQTLIEMIKERGLDLNLLEFGKLAFERVERKCSSITFENLVTEYLDKYQGTKHLTEIYRAEIRRYGTSSKYFPHLQKTLVCDLKNEEFLEVYEKVSPKVHDAMIRNLGKMFKYAVDRKYMAESPIRVTDRPKRLVKNKIQTVPLAIVEKFLNDALENDLEFLPFFVFGFFTGIRPEGEMSKVKWENVDLENRMEITIEQESSKTFLERSIPIPENALAWLKLYQERGGNMKGLILPFPEKTIRGKRNRACERVGFKWIKVGTRHTFASNWAGANGQNWETLRNLLGHIDTQMIRHNYAKPVREEEALKYWQIFPLKQEEQQKAA